MNRQARVEGGRGCKTGGTERETIIQINSLEHLNRYTSYKTNKLRYSAVQPRSSYSTRSQSTDPGSVKNRPKEDILHKLQKKLHMLFYA